MDYIIKAVNKLFGANVAVIVLIVVLIVFFASFILGILKYINRK